MMENYRFHDIRHLDHKVMEHRGFLCRELYHLKNIELVNLDTYVFICIGIKYSNTIRLLTLYRSTNRKWISSVRGSA